MRTKLLLFPLGSPGDAQPWVHLSLPEEAEEAGADGAAQEGPAEGGSPKHPSGSQALLHIDLQQKKAIYHPRPSQWWVVTSSRSVAAFDILGAISILNLGRNMRAAVPGSPSSVCRSSWQKFPAAQRWVGRDEELSVPCGSWERAPWGLFVTVPWRQ